MRRWIVCAAAALMLLPWAAAAGQVAGAPANDPQRESDDKVRLRFPPPSLRVGDAFRLDFRVRLHGDFREYSPDLPLEADTFMFRRARVGIEGHVMRDLEYEVDAELRDDEQPWRDVMVNYRRYRFAEIQAGRFKIPFGREQLTGIFTIDFVERALISTLIAPARDRGAMVHGRLADGVVRYETGMFAHDGDRARFEGEGAGRTWAGRFVASPWAGGARDLRSAQFGVAVTAGDVPEGLNGLRGRTLTEYTFFEPVYVKGRRLRLGLEAGWMPGPFSVQGEYMRAADQRNGQGLGDVDLPDAVAQGWYLSGTWAVTGGRKANGMAPGRGVLGGGIGNVELATRIETLRFGSAGGSDEEPFANPRAANLLPNRVRVLTVGVNWFPTRQGRVTLNGTREWIQDPGRSPELGRTAFWGAVCRLQFVL